jgi:hypothetical protein
MPTPFTPQCVWGTSGVYATVSDVKWKKSGCEVIGVSRSASTVTCECDHATLFAAGENLAVDDEDVVEENNETEVNNEEEIDDNSSSSDGAEDENYPVMAFMLGLLLVFLFIASFTDLVAPLKSRKIATATAAVN